MKIWLKLYLHLSNIKKSINFVFLFVFSFEHSSSENSYLSERSVDKLIVNFKNNLKLER